MHAVTTTPAATDGTCFARAFHRHRPSPTVGRVGSCIGCFGACSVFTLHYGLHDSPSRLKATLYIRGSGSFVASAAAPIATGWSESVPGRDFQPAVDHLLYTAHQQPLASPRRCVGCGEYWSTRPGNPWATSIHGALASCRSKPAARSNIQATLLHEIT